MIDCCCCCAVSQSYPNLWPQWTAACQASWFFIISQSLLQLMSIDSVMPSNHLILCCSLPLLPSVFPSIRDFSNKWDLPIRWPYYWSIASASVLPINIQGWFPLGLISLIFLLSMGLSSVNSSVLSLLYVPTLTSNTWLMERAELWLYRPLTEKWCLCFLIHCLGLSKLSFQGTSVL